ncbi:MAG: hypothetical protein GX663_09400 [Clostridiales bacterium]|nr:hypothetical protein [Clostridiales bacterium]
MSVNPCFFFLTGYFQVAYASEILKMNNVPNSIVRAPIQLKKSCNYALEVDQVFYRACISVLNKEKILIEEVLCMNK